MIPWPTSFNLALPPNTHLSYELNPLSILVSSQFNYPSNPVKLTIKINLYKYIPFDFDINPNALTIIYI